MATATDAFLDGLDGATRATVEALRAIILAADPGLDETIKWSAPSYAHRGEDRITLNLARSGGVRVILHRGATVKDASVFRFDDPDRLARWPTADRGVVQVSDAAEIDARRDALGDLIRRWIAATA